ncbi:hypothetical protein [Desulfolucanica intricata]|uniref:hypothetical protein n=1 Tax=Desulfolucanica intricata TaxID=1285191 RepID=UPI0008317167|nr:hypothetical protein [Desulfolucanica intricata]
MVNKQKSESGQALLLVIFVVLIISFLLISLISLAGKSHKAAFQQYEFTQAAYIADAGIEKIIARLKYDHKWRDVQSISSEYAGGSISTQSIKENLDNLEITTTGKYGNAQKSLKALVKIKPAPIFETYSTLMTKKSDDTGNITGDIYLPPAPINEDDKGIYLTLAQTYGSGHCFSGDKFFNEADLVRVSGLYYIDGNVFLSGNYNGRATIIATGDITVTSSVTTGDISHNSLALISYQDINVELSLTDTIINAILWSEGQLNIYGKTNVLGSIVTEKIKLYDGVLNFQFAKELVNQVPPGLPVNLDIIWWKEQYPIL